VYLRAILNIKEQTDIPSRNTGPYRTTPQLLFAILPTPPPPHHARLSGVRTRHCAYAGAAATRLPFTRTFRTPPRALPRSKARWRDGHTEQHYCVYLPSGRKNSAALSVTLFRDVFIAFPAVGSRGRLVLLLTFYCGRGLVPFLHKRGSPSTTFLVEKGRTGR